MLPRHVARVQLTELLSTGEAETLRPDEILDRFVWFAGQTGLSLYPAQEEALLELVAGKHVILNTPTGSGKSLVATALHFKALAEGKTSFYTCPIKALVNEKFFALCQTFGPDKVGMMTGDATINRGAPILCCTAEILSNLCLREETPPVDYVIMDEFHYYADKERGVAWQVPLLSLAKTTFLLMSATLGDVTTIAESLTSLTAREVAVIRSAVRPVPLDFEYRETPLHETIEALIASRRYPIYLVNFTQRACAEQAQNLMSVDFCKKDEKEAIRAALDGVKFDTPYGKEFQRFIRHGVGLHHAGLLPRYRFQVEKLAQAGLLKVISGTDTLGVGVNIPIRTVLFTQLCKYDGEKVGILSVRDFLQIAGRAGRKGFDEAGSVVAQAPEFVIENLKLAEKQKAGKKVVKQKPPTKGYVHFDQATFDRLRAGMPEPLESRFDVTHGLLLNLLQSTRAARGGGYRRLVELIARTHASDKMKSAHRRTAAQRFRSLRSAGIVALVPNERGRGRRAAVSGELQHDFSLNHTLSLYLLDTVARLEADSPTYALDVLTLVESILEDPQVVLYKQLDKLKTEKMAAMKAEGIEFDQRIEELDKMEWPKPNRDFIYDTFNAFAAKHPWVGTANIKPKSVARDLYESYCTFHDYIREYGLERVEGVLLRYLMQVYKTLTQTVPEGQRTEEVEDLIVHLRETVRRVDSTLLDEWESMRAPPATGASPPPAAAREAPTDLAADVKALERRARVELHRLLAFLAARRYAEALECLAPSDGEWTEARLADELAPFWTAHSAMRVNPDARRPSHTLFRRLGERAWQATQTIVDAEGDEDWRIDCVIDLAAPRPSDEAPLLTLRTIAV